MIEDLKEKALQLCYAIEDLPASEQQTKISIMASNLHGLLEKLVMPKIAEELKKLMIILYNQGYGAGHQDTVESCYIDIHQEDMDSYHEDIVNELIEDDSNFSA